MNQPEYERLLRQTPKGSIIVAGARRQVHYGVYMGDYMVMHLTASEAHRIPDGNNGRQALEVGGRRYTRALVRLDTIADMAGGLEIRIDNSEDANFNLRSGENICQTARNLQGEVDINEEFNSSRTFATYCRYGLTTRRRATRSFSIQRLRVMKIIKFIICFLTLFSMHKTMCKVICLFTYIRNFFTPN